MPCLTCNHTLAYHEEKELLYCPACLDLPIADDTRIKQKATQIRDQYLNNSELIGLLDEYGSLRVIASLAQQLNDGAAGMIGENRMSFQKFFHSFPILKTVYEHADDFENHFDPRNDDAQEEINECVDALLKAGTVLIPILKHIQEDFVIPLEFTPGHGNWADFYGNHGFQHSEYWLCSERCLRANVGARDEFREDFLLKEVIFRSFDKSNLEDVETVREFADHWYGLIVSLGFASAIDDTIKTAFTPQFPNSVTIFDIEALFDEVNEAVEENIVTRGTADYRRASVSENEFDACGEAVFGDEWSDVKPSITVSGENPDAHPLFFKLSGTKAVTVPGGRWPQPVPLTQIVYPNQFSPLVKFQLFPFLENGDMETSKDVLGDLTADRGDEFERYVYEFLNETTSDAYHSCKTSKQNGNEVDTIFTYNGTVYFVESKFVLPTLNMQSQVGIEDVNSTFDEKIFKEGSGSGKPFPEKVAAWRDLDADAEISHQLSRDETNRDWVEVPSDWRELEYEMLVVSNFVPSYLEKQTVRFLTDLELYQWIENGEDVFYDVLH